MNQTTTDPTANMDPLQARRHLEARRLAAAIAREREQQTLSEALRALSARLRSTIPQQETL